MNILLFESQEIHSRTDDKVILCIQGDKFKHLTEVQKFTQHSELRIGEINGRIGLGKIQKLTHDALFIAGTLTESPPKPATGKLILALPRPIMLKRILVDVAMLGIKHIVLLQSQHVQKSYWSSKVFNGDGIRQLLLRGLEQSSDTQLPELTYAHRFKPFVEDHMQNFCRHTESTQQQKTPHTIILAHPAATDICPQPAQNPFTLIVGPENGFTSYEVALLMDNGAQAYTLGQRHLRVETAATYLLGRLL